MPSINEVWEQAQQANAHLAVLHNDMVSLEQCCQEIVAGVDEVANQVVETNDWLESIRQVLVTGVGAIVRKQATTHQLLYHGIRQRDAQICQLEQVSERLCRLLTMAATQGDDLQTIATEVPTIRTVLEHAAPTAALAVAEHRRLRDEVEACCPPPTPEPACSHVPCDPPDRIEPPAKDAGLDAVAKPAAVERRARAWVRVQPQ